MAEDAAIVTDVENEEETLEQEIEEFEEENAEEEEVQLSPRDQMIEGMAERDAKIRNEELGVDEDEDDENPTPETITAKVDGEEEELTSEDFDKKLREYQKYASADKRLEEASLAKKELEAKELELLRREEALEEIKETDKVDEIADALDSATPDSEPDVSSIAQRIREGDDEEAVAAINELKAATSPSISREDMAREVRNNYKSLIAEQAEADAKAAEEADAVAAQEAESTFMDEFSEDVESNPKFYDLTVMEASAINRDPEWADKPYVERFREAGERAREWINPQQKDSRTQRKQKIKKTTSKASSKAPVHRAPPPMTSSEIIADIKKSRGQAI